MTKPITQICVPSEGVGFIIEYRKTRDRISELWDGEILLGWDNYPDPPSGQGWAKVHSCGDDSTLWRRFKVWIGPLSQHSGRRG